MSIASDVAFNDGQWHHVAVTWRSAGGEVAVYDNGEVKFLEDLIERHSPLAPGGIFVIGRTQAVNQPCILASAGDCSFESGTDYSGLVQNVRVWSIARTQKQIHLDMEWPFTALRLGLVLYYHFDFATASELYVADLGEDGDDFAGLRSINDTAIVSDSPSIDSSLYPCGNVHFNVWHFNAPRRLVSRLGSSYNGRLQFKMLFSSFSGDARPGRGAVELRDKSGNRFSYSLASRAGVKRNEWISNSVVLRESFGWIHEPTGRPAEFEEFYQALSNASELLIRGDQWVYSRKGYGQEAVYINNVSLWNARRGT